MKRFLVCLIVFFIAYPLQSEATPLHYVTKGAGSPLIFIHGGPGNNHQYFLLSMETLASDHQLIFYDQRGSGKSMTPLNLEDLNIEQFVEDLEDLRASLNLDQFTAVGHSWGALVALEYAISYPEHLSSMILLNPLPASTQDMSAFAEEVETRLKNPNNQFFALQQSPLLLEGDLPTLQNYSKELYKEFFFNPDQISKLNLAIEPQSALQGMVIYHFFEETLFKSGFDFKWKLHQVQAPTLIIHGDADPIPLWTVQEISQKIPQAKLKVLEDCGHFPHIEKPQQLFKEIRNFLD